MKDYILVVGQPSKDTLIYWLEETFGIIIKNAQDLANNEILNYSNIRINIKFCNFNSRSFDANEFRCFCAKIKPNLKAIVSIQNFNPRPQTIIEDSLKLLEIFTAKELKDKLFIFAITNRSKHETQNHLMNDRQLGFNQLLELTTNSSDEFRNKIFLFNQDDFRKFQAIMNKSSTFKKSVILFSKLGVLTALMVAFVIIVKIDIDEYFQTNFTNLSIETCLNKILETCLNKIP